MTSAADAQASFYEIEAAAGGHRCRSQHCSLDLIEQVFFEDAGNIDWHGIDEHASTPFLAPVNEVRLIGTDNELEIEFQALSSTRDVFELGWGIADYAQSCHEPIDRL